MRLPRECYQMQKTIETHLPHLSQPQLTGLVHVEVCGAIRGRQRLSERSVAFGPLALAQDGTTCASISANGSTTAVTGPAPAKDPAGRYSLLRTVAEMGPRLVAVRWTWRLAIDPTLKGDQTTAIVISVLIPQLRHSRGL